VLDVLRQISAEMGIDLMPHDLSVHHVGGESAVSFHCALPPDTPITDAHKLTERIESALRARLSGLGRVVIHVETPEKGETKDPAAM
jgi:divalent metal cation (Fe/Co/Zn/Cd) transporter